MAVKTVKTSVKTIYLLPNQIAALKTHLLGKTYRKSLFSTVYTFDRILVVNDFIDFFVAELVANKYANGTEFQVDKGVPTAQLDALIDKFTQELPQRHFLKNNMPFNWLYVYTVPTENFLVSSVKSRVTGYNSENRECVLMGQNVYYIIRQSARIRSNPWIVLTGVVDATNQLLTYYTTLDLVDKIFLVTDDYQSLANNIATLKHHNIRCDVIDDVQKGRDLLVAFVATEDQVRKIFPHLQLW
jgi:hypothetical protein